jgi:valyl-tRNA synthetase
LDQALKLLHPFMPFVTEELYQRLPRRPNDTCRSIMLAPYPQPVVSWANSKAAEDFEFINGVVGACRSLTAEYNIKDYTMYVQNPTQTDLLKREAHTIYSLIRNCAKFDIIGPTDVAPEGCTLNTLADTNIYLVVKGKVDLEKEILKLKKKLDKITILAADIKKRQSGEGYAANVKEEVKQVDATKLNGYEAEITALSSTIKSFSKMLL